jgi:hypothetical protein
MSGKRLVSGLLVFTVIFAAALIWFQFFAYYHRERGVTALPAPGGPVPVADYDGIDADTSPLKLRGCFRVDPALVGDLPPAERATPLVAPFWFRCFDAGRLTRDLASGAAAARLVAHDTPSGFDLLVAVYPDGRGYLWRQLVAGEDGE